jgi:hypothetical protein
MTKSVISHLTLNPLPSRLSLNSFVCVPIWAHVRSICIKPFVDSLRASAVGFACLDGLPQQPAIYSLLCARVNSLILLS